MPIYAIYMLVLDISCQHLDDDCNLEGFFVPFGHRVGECTFLKITILLDMCCQQLDISHQPLGDDCKLKGFFVPFGHTFG